MTKNDYKELNEYLNLLGLALQKYDKFFVNNIIEIGNVNEEFYIHYYDYEFNQEINENHLTFDDVFNLAREIIEKINPKYLPLFNNLIKSGELNFNYNNENGDSFFIHDVDGNIIHNSIEIDREFNYSDVWTLIHEFFHYLNGHKKSTIMRHILTEFISIYFELFAIDYLIKKGIPKSEIDYTMRLFSTFHRVETFYYVESPLICYFTFGSVDDISFNLFKQYLVPINKKTFEQECEILLKYFRKKKNVVKTELVIYNNQDLQEEYALDISKYYRYFYGTLLAFYARGQCQVDDIIYLNDHINDSNITSLVEFLRKGNIYINDEDFLKKCFQSIDEYIIQYRIKQRS